MKPARTQLGIFAGLALGMTLALSAQTPEPAKTTEPAPAQSKHEIPPYGPTVTRVFYLKNLTTQQEANEALTVLRNVTDPRDRLTMMPSQDAIVMEASTEHIDDAEKLLTDLDKPKRTYRLTYTLIDLDGTKRLGDQHYSMVLVSGQRTILKQGNRVPVFTGTDAKSNSQITYLDVGMNFDATIDDAQNSLRLKAKVEQSSIVEDRTSALAQDPIVRQSLFEGTAFLTPGKPLVIGSLDIVGTTRRIEIQATVEPLTP